MLRAQRIGVTETTVLADEPLLEQALVNLVRKAIDATVTTAGTVTTDWRAEPTRHTS